MCFPCSAGSRWHNTGVPGPGCGEWQLYEYSRSGAAPGLHRFHLFPDCPYAALPPVSVLPIAAPFLQRKKRRKERRQNQGFEILPWAECGQIRNFSDTRTRHPGTMKFVRLPDGGVWAPRPTAGMKAGTKITDCHANDRGRMGSVCGGTRVSRRIPKNIFCRTGSMCPAGAISVGRRGRRPLRFYKKFCAKMGWAG